MIQHSPNETEGSSTMKVEAVATALNTGKSSPRCFAPPPSRLWTCTIVAQFLTGLLRRPVAAEEVQRRAVGLGLSRYPGGDLCFQSIARLFLSAYHLPAHIEEGTLPLLESHLTAGRRTWVVLRDEPTVYRIIGLQKEPFGELLVLVRAVGSPFVIEQQLPAEAFVERWRGVGCPLVVAAAAWNDLPATGAVFFAGLRDRDGSYRWVTAECDTDGRGRILRF
jgi:hypothetical protein